MNFTITMNVECLLIIMLNNRGIPTRLAAALWWFFALIVTASYTANMTAFLTKDQMEATIENVEDLAKDNKIKYGCLEEGSTETFFKVRYFWPVTTLQTVSSLILFFVKESNVTTYQKVT